MDVFVYLLKVIVLYDVWHIFLSKNVCVCCLLSNLLFSATQTNQNMLVINYRLQPLCNKIK